MLPKNGADFTVLQANMLQTIFNATHPNVLSNDPPVIVGVRQLIVATVARLLGCMHRFVQKAVHERRSLIVCTWVQLKIRN